MGSDRNRADSLTLCLLLGPIIVVFCAVLGPVATALDYWWQSDLSAIGHSIVAPGLVQ